MTTLKGDSRVVRETAAFERGKPLIVELRASSSWLRIRPKGARYASYEVDYQAIFHLGARKAAENLMAERQKAKLERRGKKRPRR
jgi:hypothetical protein